MRRRFSKPFAIYMYINLYKTKFPWDGPYITLYNPENFICTHLSLCLKVDRCQPLDLRKLESPFPKDASYQIWLKSVQWFWRVSVLNVFPYIILRKMKCPLVMPFLGIFYFYVQTLQTMFQGCCLSNISVFGLPVHENKIF